MIQTRQCAASMWRQWIRVQMQTLQTRMLVDLSLRGAASATADRRHSRSRVAWRRHCGGRTGAGAATTAPAIVATIEVALCLRRRSWPLQWWRCLLLSRPARCRRRAAEAALRTQCGVSADPLSQEMARVPAAPPGEVPAACCEGSAADPLPSKFVS